MAKVKANSSSGESKRLRPALTPEGNENQMISLAMDAARKQLLDGTASSQIIVHFLKLGTSRAELEVEKLRAENALLEAKRKSLEDEARHEETYLKAIAAMKRYSGHADEDVDDDDSDIF